MKLKSIKLFAILLFLCGPAHAQNYKFPYGDDVTFDNLAARAPATRKREEMKDFLSLERGTNLTKLGLYAGGYEMLLQAAQEARLDKQTGATSSSGGTTSLVSKGIGSQVLGLAVESGALTRTDNQTIATFRGNAIGVARLLRGARRFPYCAVFDPKCESPLARTLGGASFSVSFDTSRNGMGTSAASGGSGSNNNVLAGSARQVSGWSVRYDFHVRRSALSKNYQTQWESTLKNDFPTTQANAYLVAVNALSFPILKSPEYADWLNRYSLILISDQAAGEEGLKKVLARAVEELAELAKKNDSDFQTKAENLLKNMGNYFGARDKALDTLVNPLTFSFEYDNDRPLNQPSQSNGKFILSYRLDSTGRSQLTFNSTVAWYDQAPPQASVRRLRAAQSALQLDFGLTPQNARVGASLSGGYYFQFMADNALLSLPSSAFAPGTTIPLPGNASVLLNTKGSIHLGQAQITFSIRGTGIKIPISLSFSSRTELIKASEVRGHFGITYDLDSLFTKK